jgi:hypothetical protein
LKIQTVNARAMPTLLLCKEILIEQRAQLAAKMEEMQRTLDFLDYKIEVYEKAVLETEKEIIQIDD